MKQAENYLLLERDTGSGGVSPVVAVWLLFLFIAVVSGVVMESDRLRAGQVLTPAEDLSNAGGWEPEPLHQELLPGGSGEITGPADFSQDGGFEVALELAPDPASYDEHRIVFSAKAETGSELYLRADLFESGSLIHKGEFLGPLSSDGMEQLRQEVDEQAARKIKDHDDLSIKIIPKNKTDDEEARVVMDELYLETAAPDPVQVDSLQVEVDSDLEAHVKGAVETSDQESVSRRGAVLSEQSHSHPGDQAPEDGEYEKKEYEAGEFADEDFEVTFSKLQPDSEYFTRSFVETDGGYYDYGAELSFTAATGTTSSSGGDDGSGDGDDDVTFSTTDTDDDGELLSNSDPQGEPEISGVKIDQGDDINLVENATTSVPITATATHPDGYHYLKEDTLSGRVYRSSLGEDCELDDNNCYSIVNLEFNDCVDTRCQISGEAKLWYFAEPTDQGEWEDDDWSAYLKLEDTAEQQAEDHSSAVELLTLLAFAVLEEKIDYGQMEIGQDTGAENQITTIRNTGNLKVEMELSGQDMELENGGPTTLPPDRQQWSLEPFNYGDPEAEALTGEYSAINLKLPKAISASDPSQSKVYWGLSLPGDDIYTGSYSGVNYFMSMPAE